MSYGANSEDLYRRSAEYMDKILRGAKPSGLPEERPTKFEFTINLKTAKALGLKIPPSVGSVVCNTQPSKHASAIGSRFALADRVPTPPRRPFPRAA